MTDLTLQRDDGRALACRQVGADDGPLVVYLHGAPSSRLDIDHFAGRAVERGIRLVAFDRPGYGRSDYTDFDFASVAADVCAVADHQQADQAYLVGQSAGAAYALAAAALAPDRVAAVCAAGGGAPFLPGTSWWAELSEEEQQGLELLGTDDALASRLLAEADLPFMVALEQDDAGLLAFWRDICSPPDQRLLDAGFGSDRLVPTVRESLRQGQRGWARDNVVRMGPWAFDLGAVRCPVLVWYGEADHTEPGKWMVERLPAATLRVVAGHGHFSLFEAWDDVLDELGVVAAGR